MDKIEKFLITQSIEFLLQNSIDVNLVSNNDLLVYLFKITSKQEDGFLDFFEKFTSDMVKKTSGFGVKKTLWQTLNVENKTGCFVAVTKDVLALIDCLALENEYATVEIKFHKSMTDEKNNS